MTPLERLDQRVNEARKLLERATTKRDKAVADLIRASANIKKAQQALSRTEKRRVAHKAEMRKSKKRTAGLNDALPESMQ